MPFLDDIRTFRIVDKNVAELAQKINGTGKYENTLFMPTQASYRLSQGELEALAKQVEGLDRKDPVSDVLAGHFADFLDATEQRLKNYYDKPGQIFQFLGGRLYALCCADYRPARERYSVMHSKLMAVEQLWEDGIKPTLGSLEPDKLNNLQLGLKQAAKTYDFTRPKIKKAFRGLNTLAINALENEMEEYLANLELYIEHVGEIMEEKGEAPRATVRGDEEVIPISQEEYRNTLKNNIGVDLDELLSWYEYENDKTRAESLELANKIRGPVRTTAEVGDILFKYAGPCSSPDEMFARANEYLKRARAAAHEYIWLPHDERCDCLPIPEQLKDSYPWGGYNSDYPSRYPLHNTMFLNNFNYTAITDGWIKINALHEAYPGHHAQFIRTAIDPIPETMKRGAKSVPLSEGTCIRTERVFEFVFAEDPYYPLMVAHRRHHTSTRIKVDLWLHYFGKTIGQACDLYQQEMGFDRKTARAQVQAHENMCGYFTSYYYGMKKICDWEKSYFWDRVKYTELLFSVGRVSLDTFEKILKLSPRKRHSLLHDYASLIQFR